MGKIQTTVTAATIIALLVGAVLTVSSITATTGTFTTVDSTIIYVADITNRTTDGYVEIMRLVVENGSSFPSSPSIGHVFFNTALDTLTVYNGTSWVNMTTSDVVADHGALTGLTDDDHTIYLLADGTRALSATWDVSSQGIIGLTWLNTTSLVFTDEIWYGLDNRTDVIANPQEAWSYLIYVDPDNSSLYHGKASNGTICWTSTNASYVWNSAVSATGEAGGGTVFGRNGLYPLDTPILIEYSYVTIEGEGCGERVVGEGATILKLDDGANCNVFNITKADTQLYSVEIKHLKIEGNSGNNPTGGHGIYAMDVKQARFSDLMIQYCKKSGIYIDGTSEYDSREPWIRDSYIQNCDEYGIYLGEYAYDSWTNNVLVSICGKSGIALMGITNRVISSHFAYCTENGILAQNKEQTIMGNTVEINFQHGILIQGGEAGEAYRSTVTGNTIYDSGYEGGGNTYDGLRLSQVSGIVITGNRILDTRASGSKTQRYGIGIYDCNNLTITGNDLRGNEIDAIQSVNSNDIVRNNQGFNNTYSESTYIIYQDDSDTVMQKSDGTITSSTNASEIFNWAIGNSTNGGQIFVRTGEYNISTTALEFFDLNDVTFTGEGKSTYIHGTADDILDIRRCTGLLITNLKITHNSTYGAIYDAIDMDDSQNCIVSNVWIVGDGTHGGNGITVDGGALGTSYYNFVTDNYIENVPGMGIQLIDSIGNGICGNVINKTGSYGIGLSSASTQNTIQANRINNSSIGIHLVSNTVKSNTVNTNTVVNTTNQGIYINGQNNTISGNTVSNTLGEGIYIERSDNTVSINTVVDADSYGIYVSGSRNTVSTNVVNGVTGGSVRGIGVYNGAENVVSANSVTGCAQGLYTFGSTRTLWTSNIVTSCTTAGFWTWSSNDNRFVGNRFYNNDRGIFVDSSANNYFIFANFFESNTNDGIRIDSGTGNVIQGNLFSSNGATITVPVTTTIIKDNGGYNPLGVIANPILSGQTTLLDSGGDSQIANATTYTNWCSPKTVYMQDADTFDVYVEGQLVADDVNQYVVTLQPSDTFKIEWVSALTTLKFVGN